MASSAQHQQQNHAPDWGYAPNQLTPEKWPQYFEAGEQQSPINILLNTCRHCSNATGSGNRGSTCCRGTLIDKTQNIASLTSKFREQTALNRPPRRSHLDSVGEEEREHGRSLSASSAGSSESSSSAGRDDTFSSESGNDDSDEKTAIDNGQCQRRLNSKQCNRLEHHHNMKHHHHQQQQQLQNTRYVVSLRKVFLGYPRFMNTMQLFNTGHNWQVNLPNELANHTRKFCFVNSSVRSQMTSTASEIHIIPASRCLKVTGFFC